MIQFLVILAFLLGVVFFVSAPFRRPQAGLASDVSLVSATPGARVLDLEAAREAKYREIRDAELDHQTGKLSDDDYLQLDAALRAEALEILDALDRVQSTA